MNEAMIRELEACETDVAGALQRLYQDDKLYQSLVLAYLRDTTVEELEVAIREKDWDGAFTAAHAIKGLAGNLGFIPLFHATAELVLVIRSGRVKEVNDATARVKNCHLELIEAIRAGSGIAAAE